KFCNASVNFILAHDRAGQFRFAALQSDAGQRLLRQFGLSTTDVDTVVLVEGGRYSARSTAALRVAWHLGWPWRLGAARLVLPAVLRDPLYDLLASQRYRWFGRLDACVVPTPQVRARFLD